jgi:hypothetical protein
LYDTGPKLLFITCTSGTTVRERERLVLDIDAAVGALAVSHPDRVPVLRAMCRAAKQAERWRLNIGEFDVEMVKLELGGRLPGNLSFFTGRGLIVRNDEGRRRYYQMPQRLAIEQALSRLHECELVDPLTPCCGRRAAPD